MWRRTVEPRVIVVSMLGEGSDFFCCEWAEDVEGENLLGERSTVEPATGGRGGRAVGNNHCWASDDEFDDGADGDGILVGHWIWWVKWAQHVRLRDVDRAVEQPHCRQVAQSPGLFIA
jgi:hypothetical protein